MGRNDLDRRAVGLVKAGGLEHLQGKVALQDAAVPIFAVNLAVDPASNTMAATLPLCLPAATENMRAIASGGSCCSMMALATLGRA
jgi:hypothetical protein